MLMEKKIKRKQNEKNSESNFSNRLVKNSQNILVTVSLPLELQNTVDIQES